MNRASAETQKEIAEEEGLWPVLNWAKQLLDDVVEREFGAPHLEFAWGQDQQIDPSQQAVILSTYVKGGALTINEARAQLGMAPLSEPAANTALTLTANGYVGIAAGAAAANQLARAPVVPQAHPSTGALTRAAQDEDLERAAHLSRTNPLVLSLSKDERGRARNANLRFDKYSPDQPRVPAGQSDGGQWTSGGASTPTSLLDDGVYRPAQDGAPKLTLVQAEGEPDEESEEREGLKPEELPALALYRQKLREALKEVEAIDPDWRPPDQLTGLDAQGNPVFADEIKNMQETIDAARARVADVNRLRLLAETQLDPHGLNTPLTEEDQAQITSTLARIRYNGGKNLHPHPYRNVPSNVTGAVLPQSENGYTTFDVKNFGAGRGEGRIIIDSDTGAIYFTKFHYLSFYRIR